MGDAEGVLGLWWMIEGVGFAGKQIRWIMEVLVMGMDGAG